MGVVLYLNNILYDGVGFKCVIYINYRRYYIDMAALNYIEYKITYMVLGSATGTAKKI